jgi:hypothetical protein
VIDAGADDRSALNSTVRAGVDDRGTGPAGGGEAWELADIRLQMRGADDDR